MPASYETQLAKKLALVTLQKRRKKASTPAQKDAYRIMGKMLKVGR